MTSTTSTTSHHSTHDAAASSSLPATDVIDARSLRRLRDTDPDIRILDVRTGGEFESLHIPGSYNVPLDTLGEHVRDLADVEHPVVLVCQSGNRAAQAHGRLVEAGKDTLHILEGGMQAWQQVGGDTASTAQSRWAMDRQVRLVAGSLSLFAVLLSLVVPKAKWGAAAVAAGLTYSAVSNTCAMATVLSKLPYNRTDRCDVAGVLAELNRVSGPSSTPDSPKGI